jgi:hypothetical protein
MTRRVESRKLARAGLAMELRMAETPVIARHDRRSCHTNANEWGAVVFDVLDDVERNQRIEVVVLADHS